MPTIPRNTKFCVVFVATAQFGPHRVITKQGRALATSVSAEYQHVQHQLERTFGSAKLIGGGSPAIMTTMHIVLDPPKGSMDVDNRLGTAVPTRTVRNSEFLRDTFRDDKNKLVFAFGDQANIIRVAGHQHARDLKSCQGLVLFLDSELQTIGVERLLPAVTNHWQVEVASDGGAEEGVA